MKKYDFLFKPFLFICSVIFAAWLTLKIEKLQPSDFGTYKSLFEKKPQLTRLSVHSKIYLKKLFSNYTAGLIDSVKLNTELQNFIDSPIDTCIISQTK